MLAKRIGLDRYACKRYPTAISAIPHGYAMCGRMLRSPYPESEAYVATDYAVHSTGLNLIEHVSNLEIFQNNRLLRGHLS